MAALVCSISLLFCCGSTIRASEAAERDWPDGEAGELLKELEQLQNDRQTGELAWARTMQKLILLGPDAVPDLIEAIDATPSDDRLMLRSIPFALRGIGDKRAIPALIRAIPRCYGTDGSDMGYACEDPELLKFLQKHDHEDRDEGATYYSYGRPVNEIFPTLERWTGVKHNWNELAFVSDRTGTERQQQLKQKLFQDHARRWEQWWEEHWQEYVDDEQYAKVNLPQFERLKPIEHRPDLELSLRHVSSVSNMIVQPIEHAHARRSLYDLDTGRWSGLPEQFRKMTSEQLTGARAEILEWAQSEGFDLMGAQIEQNGQAYYVIETIDLTAWEIPMTLWKSDVIDKIRSLISEGRPADGLLAHYDVNEKAYKHDQTGLFFYITNEGTPGQLYLGIEVKDTNVVRGIPASDNEELNPKGFWKGRRFALGLLEPVE